MEMRFTYPIYVNICVHEVASDTCVVKTRGTNPAKIQDIIIQKVFIIFYHKTTRQQSTRNRYLELF
jgi:hypothetical protein